MNRSLLLASISFALAAGNELVRSDTVALPGDGFPASRYETLWTKSPFAIATPDAVQGSPDYKLVGIARNEGVSYASLIDNASGQHFLLSSDKPVNGLVLVSILGGKGSAGNQAVVQKNGQPITLVQDTSESAPGPGVPMGSINAPPGAQPLPMPGATGFAGGNFPPGMPPAVRRRLSAIRLPPNPAQQIAPPPAPPAAP